ncbi:MAG: phage integrase N-terminal SAM-like domain-containing protein [Bacillota bacterium]|nr:phage integrase N-terminal SAM-like domain-containing protein [Bacillota bacterium]
MDYEKQIEENSKKNEVLLNDFENSMMNEKLTNKTIMNHVFNVDLFINDFLNYYEATAAEEGIEHIDDFLSDWFIRKTMWSSESSVKQNITSLKKFYKFMMGEGLISKDKYDYMIKLIKDTKDFWISTVNEYNNEEDADDYLLDDDFDDMFDDELMAEMEEDAYESFFKEVKELGVLKPWNWLDDTDVFGIHQVETDEDYFICVIGGAGESYGIIVYEELSGLKSYIKQLNGEFDDPIEVFNILEAVVIHYDKKSYLDSVDIEMIKKSGVAFKGKNFWPMVRVYEPGYLPDMIETYDMSEMAELLEIVKDMVVLFKNEPKRLTDLDDDQIYIREASFAGTFKDTKKTYEELFISESNEISVPVYINELELKRVEKSCKRTLDIWELDSFYHIEPVQNNEDEIPFFPAMILAVNIDNGMILGQNLTHPDTQGEDFQRYVLKMISELKVLPKKVNMRNEELIKTVLPIFDSMKIEIVPKNKLEIIPDIKRDLFKSKG